ncbi:putative GTP-binding protein EngB [Nitrospira sp.]|nr:putative GTP-binding protein EngB [Nitrospira sp.]
MRIVSAEFTRSCVSPEQFPADAYPEFAVVGRSNVGKSSLINALLQRKHLARVSRTPGKTQAVNFFDVRTGDPRLSVVRLVDLPGYGYARVSKSLQREWGPLIEAYLTRRTWLRCVLLLVDARGVEASDENTYAWLRHCGQDPLVVMTKVDKLKRGERRSAEAGVCDALGIEAGVRPFTASSVTKEGRDELWKAIASRLKT